MQIYEKTTNMTIKSATYGVNSEIYRTIKKNCEKIKLIYFRILINLNISKDL